MYFQLKIVKGIPLCKNAIHLTQNKRCYKRVGTYITFNIIFALSRKNGVIKLLVILSEAFENHLHHVAVILKNAIPSTWTFERERAYVCMYNISK